jgi:hypothetical protein
MAANKSNEAFKQELAPVRLVDRSWVSDCDLRSRLFVERALPMYFVHAGALHDERRKTERPLGYPFAVIHRLDLGG